MVRKRFDSSTFLSKVGKGRTILPCRKGQVVFRQGDPAEAVFFVQDGRVKLTVVSQRGKEAVVAVLNPDSFFGEGCLQEHDLEMSRLRNVLDTQLLQLAQLQAEVDVLHGRESLDPPGPHQMHTAFA